MIVRTSTVSFAVAAAIMLTGVMLYDVMSAIVKHLGQDYSAPQLAMLRNFFGLVPTLFILFWSRDWIDAGRPVVIRQWKLALARGGVGTFAQVSLYLALSHLEFATTTTIVFAAPLFVTALSLPVLGQPVGLWRWLAVMAGFVGVVLVMRPAAESFNWYTILPLCAALGFATTSVSSRLISKTVPTAIVNLYYTAGTLAGTTMMVIFTDGFTEIGSPEDWAWIVAMGVVGGLAAYCWTSAYRLADASSLSPFQYFGIPFSFFLGWFFFA
ncbi:MAG: DMT family transporter [Rhodospirillales bacterium]